MNRVDRLREPWIRRIIHVLTAVAAIAALAVVATPTAHAEGRYQVAWTGIGIYPQSAPSMGSGPAGPALPDGATVTVVCEQQGGPVFNGDKTIDVWERLDTGGWLPNAFINTGYDGYTPGIPHCSDYLDQLKPGLENPYVDPAQVEEKNNLPCDRFIDQAELYDRQGTQTVRVTPTACGLEKAKVAKQAAFDELYHMLNANWHDDEYWSLHNQFTCHAEYWNLPGVNKRVWNLEFGRPNVGYFATVISGCGNYLF